MQNKIIAYISITFCILLASLWQPAWAGVMQSGAWEMKSKVTAHNVATGESKNMNDSSSTFCLSPAFIAKDTYLTPAIDKSKMAEKKAKCSISDEKKSADAASWKMTCKTQDGQVVDAFISNKVSSSQLTSNVEQVVDQGGKKIKLNIDVNGKFIGKCSKDMPVL